MARVWDKKLQRKDTLNIDENYTILEASEYHYEIRAKTKMVRY